MAFGEPNSHGCIFNVPQADAFFRVVLKILGSISSKKTEEKRAKIQVRNRRSIWQNSSLL